MSTQQLPSTAVAQPQDSMQTTSVRPGGPKPLSILVVSHTYPPTLGGSEVEAQRVCSALIQRGYRVKVVCTGGPPMPDQSEWIDPEGVPVRIIGRRWGTGAWRDRVFALGVAWTLLREGRNYDAVYFLMQGIHLALGMPITKALGIPFVMKFSGSNVIPALVHSWMGRLELRWLGEWSRRIMVLNDGMVREADEAGLPRHLLEWMPNPVDVDDFVPASEQERVAFRERVGLTASTPILLFVGRLIEVKELPSLIGAFALALRDVPDAKLVLLGDGPDRQMAEELVRRHGIEASVRFMGRVPLSEVKQWLQASDVFALVSSKEGFSCALVEAMAVGLPAVVSDIPANTQLVEDGVTGVVTRLKDESDLAAGMVKLLNNRDLCRRMGETARRCAVDNYSTPKVVDRYEAMFHAITRNSQ